MSNRGHIVSTENKKTVQHKNRKTRKMQCPYLETNPKRTCKKMLEAEVDEAISDFDLAHYCEGNPICCYYRFSITQDTQETSAADQEKPPTAVIPETQKKP
jgi:hypothetical protein